MKFIDVDLVESQIHVLTRHVSNLMKNKAMIKVINECHQMDSNLGTMMLLTSK